MVPLNNYKIHSRLRRLPVLHFIQSSEWSSYTPASWSLLDLSFIYPSFLSDFSAAAVSYTHLDVYKRQPVSGFFINRLKNNNKTKQ